MNARRSPLPALALVTVLAAVPPSPAAAAQQADLSCMGHEVRSKTQVTERYKEYDVVVANSCPGPVYWSMCIERLDPVTHRILETHTPNGYVEADKKVRVNLQMKKAPDAMDFRPRFQEFYVAVGYAIEPPARVSCVAKGCESARRGLRRQIDGNLQAWKAAARSLQSRLAAECPESGWGRTEQVERCEASIRANAQPRLDELAQRDAALRDQLAQAGAAGCELHAGELVPE